MDGQNVVYNPNQLRQLSNEATVYRPEDRDLAVGDRIRFTASDKENGVRLGSFATVERIGEDNSLTVRTDAGKAIELDEAQARHIDYGYTVDSAKYLAADRVLLTGENTQLAEQRVALTNLSPHTKDFAIYTSDGSKPLHHEHFHEAHSVSVEHPAHEISNPQMPEPATEIEMPSYGISL